jgi:hypothetical protein
MTRFALDALTEAVNSDVAAHGLRPTAERRGLPLSILRGAIEQRNLTVDSLAELAKTYEMELYIGPPRDLASSPLPSVRPKPISLDDLTLAVELVERTLDRLNRELPPRRKAEAIADFYNRIEKGGMVEPATIERLMKIA